MAGPQLAPQPPRRLTALQTHLGVRFVAAEEPGTLAVQIAVRDDLRGPAGSLEGGAIATLIDVAGASCAARALQALPATQAISLCYLNPVKVGPAHATARPLRVGRRDAVVEVQVLDLGSDRRLCASALLMATALTAGSGQRSTGSSDAAAPPADAP